ncbi:TPA: hypothetical protein DEP34_03975 [Candidatus Uhrbacteria bacterium]|nr:hypothetical protein [Candidatus Uhrbacteria bacterium]HCB19511.1 hypothetical protein [Candidatus Uhrbacteria bacterium]
MGTEFRAGNLFPTQNPMPKKLANTSRGRSLKILYSGPTPSFLFQKFPLSEYPKNAILFLSYSL